MASSSNGNGTGVLFPTVLHRMVVDDGDLEQVPEQLERATVKYKGLYQRFIQQTKTFAQQYSHMYLQRLIVLRDVISANAKLKWDDQSKYGKIVEKIIDLGAGDKGIVIGTLYKDQSLKPCVLDEFSHEFSGTYVSKERDNYVSDDDKLILEDESGRMVLISLDQDLINSLVTGIVVAVQGDLLSTGEFSCSGICYADFPPCIPRKIPVLNSPEALRLTKYVLLVSGLEMGRENDPLRSQLLVDYLLGHLGSLGDQKLELGIVRVIVAGGCVSSQTLPTSDASDPIDPKMQEDLVAPIRNLDALFAELCSSIPVDVMPGKGDPCTYTLPQQGFNQCLFPHASRFSTFKRVTNPYECKLDDTTLVTGHSGQPIEDMLKYTKGLSAIQILEDTLRWRHIAPTAPDTLACYPFIDSDPFVIEKCPHIYFSGNQSTFETRLIEHPNHAKTRLISLPKFAETGLAVLVDINSFDLECSTICFDGNVGE